MRAIDYLNKHGLEYCKNYLEETSKNPYLGDNFWVTDKDDGKGRFHINALRELVDMMEYSTIVQTTNYQSLVKEIKVLRGKQERQSWIDNPAQGMF